MTCSEVDFDTHSRVCEIEEDGMIIEIFVFSWCYRSILSCGEGDIKTCMPLVTINTRMPEDVSTA